MASIFSRIVKGEIPSYKVAEDDKFLAFLDIRPLVIGHTLAIPKKEIDYIFDLEDALLCELMLFSKKVAGAIKTVIPCERVGLSVVGLEVPHAHIHLLPINSIADMDFNRKVQAPSADDFSSIAKKINTAYSALYTF